MPPYTDQAGAALTRYLGVLVTFLIAKTKYLTPKVKRGKV